MVVYSKSAMALLDLDESQLEVLIDSFFMLILY